MEQIEKFLRKLGKRRRAQLLALIANLQKGEIPRNADLKPLRGLKNCYRIRKGDIRIIFVRENNQIGLIRIDFRKDVY